MTTMKVPPLLPLLLPHPHPSAGGFQGDSTATARSESTSSTSSCSAPQFHLIPMGFPWGIDFGNANCVMAGKSPTPFASAAIHSIDRAQLPGAVASTRSATKRRSARRRAWCPSSTESGSSARARATRLRPTSRQVAACRGLCEQR